MSHHIIAGQQLLQEVSLLVLDSLDDELVVGRNVEHAARSAGVGQLPAGTIKKTIENNKQTIEKRKETIFFSLLFFRSRRGWTTTLERNNNKLLFNKKKRIGQLT